jgi:hypothetical protein
MSDIFHLVYSSKATIKISTERLEEILKIAREKNEAYGISGLLLYRHGFFIQLLEGNEDQVYKIYNKIKTDSRHQDAFILAEFHSETRLFQNWSMGSIIDKFENERIIKKLESLLKTPIGFKDNMKNQVIEIFQHVNKKNL